MVKKYIELLQAQNLKLQDKDFDLKSWKIATVLVIDRIFGENSKKAEEIANINYDMSSWALRDTLAKQSNIDVCKQKGKSILDAAISELQILGIPGNEDKNLLPLDLILDALKDEVKGSQYKEIIEMIKARSKYDEKRTKILDRLKTYGAEVSENILASILANEEMKKKV